MVSFGEFLQQMQRGQPLPPPPGRMALPAPPRQLMPTPPPRMPMPAPPRPVPVPIPVPVPVPMPPTRTPGMGSLSMGGAFGAIQPPAALPGLGSITMGGGGLAGLRPVPPPPIFNVPLPAPVGTYPTLPSAPVVPAAPAIPAYQPITALNEATIAALPEDLRPGAERYVERAGRATPEERAVADAQYLTMLNTDLSARHAQSYSTADTSILQAAGAVAGAVNSVTVNDAGRAVEYAFTEPQQQVFLAVGESIYQSARAGKPVMGGLPDALFQGSDDGLDILGYGVRNQAKVVAAYENGYTPSSGAFAGQLLTGDRAVWEMFSNEEQNRAQRFITSGVLDPANIATLPFAMGRNLVRGAVAVLDNPAASAGARAGARVAQTTGRVLQAPDVLLNRGVDNLVESLGSSVGNVIRRIDAFDNNRGAQAISDLFDQTGRVKQDILETESIIMLRDIGAQINQAIARLTPPPGGQALPNQPTIGGGPARPVAPTSRPAPPPAPFPPGTVLNAQGQVIPPTTTTTQATLPGTQDARRPVLQALPSLSPAPVTQAEPLVLRAQTPDTPAGRGQQALLDPPVAPVVAAPLPSPPAAPVVAAVPPVTPDPVMTPPPVRGTPPPATPQTPPTLAPGEPPSSQAGTVERPANARRSKGQDAKTYEESHYRPYEIRDKTGYDPATRTFTPIGGAYKPRVVDHADLLTPEQRAIFDARYVPASEAFLPRQTAEYHRVPVAVQELRDRLTREKVAPEAIDNSVAALLRQRELDRQLREAAHIIDEAYPALADAGMPMPNYYMKEGQGLVLRSDRNLIEHAIFGNSSSDGAIAYVRKGGSKGYPPPNPDFAAALAEVRARYVAQRGGVAPARAATDAVPPTPEVLDGIASGPEAAPTPPTLDEAIASVEARRAQPVPPRVVDTPQGPSTRMDLGEADRPQFPSDPAVARPDAVGEPLRLQRQTDGTDAAARQEQVDQGQTGMDLDAPVVPKERLAIEHRNGQPSNRFHVVDTETGESLVDVFGRKRAEAWVKEYPESQRRTTERRRVAEEEAARPEEQLRNPLAPDQPVTSVLDDPAEVAKAAAPPPRTKETATDPTPDAPEVPGLMRMNADDVVLDPKNFQPRSQRTNKTGIDEQTIQNIVNDFDPNLWKKPLLVWKRPEDGKWVVVGGHHRHEAARRMDIPFNAMEVEGDLATAKRIGRRDNSINVMKPSAYGGAIQAELDEGMTLAKAAETHKVTGADARRYLQITKLPDDMQILVDAKTLDVNIGARFGKAIEDGLLSPAAAQSIYVNQFLKKDWSVTSLDNVLNAAARRKAAMGTQTTQGGMFDGLDLGSPEADVVFENLQALEIALKKEQIDRKALKTVMADPDRSPAFKKEAQDALTSTEKKIATLKTDLGFKPRKGQGGTTYGVTIPGIPQLAGAAGRAGRKAFDALSVPSEIAPTVNPTRPGGRPDLDPGDEAFPTEDIFDVDKRVASTNPTTISFSQGPEPMRWPGEAGNPPTGATVPTKSPYEKLWTKAKATATVEDGIRVFEDAATAKFGPRANNRHVPTKVDRSTGKLADPDGMTYNKDRGGNEWKRTDDEIKRFQAAWSKVRTMPADGKMTLSAQSEASANKVFTGGYDPEKAGRTWGEHAARLFQEHGDMQVVTDKFVDDLAKDTGQAITDQESTKIGRGWDLVGGLMRERIRYSPENAIRTFALDFLGDVSQMVQTGNIDSIALALDPKLFREMWRNVKKGTTGLDGISDGPVRDLTDGFGMTSGYQPQLSRASVRDDLGPNARLGKGPTRVVASAIEKKLLGGAPVLSKGVAPLLTSQLGRELNNAREQVFRQALWMGDILGKYPTVLREFRGTAKTRAKTWNISDDVVKQVDQAIYDLAVEPVTIRGLRGKNVVPKGATKPFGPDDVREAVTEVLTRNGVTGDALPWYPDRLARDWTDRVRTMSDDGVDAANKALFSYRETNLDAKLRRVVFFHYWASRAAPLYIESAMRHPGLINAYFNAVDSMDRDGMPENMKWFIPLAGSAFGFTAFVNPVGLFQTAATFRESTFDPEGESAAFRILRKSGLFAHPILGFMGDQLGYAGSGFPIDPTMSASTRRVFEAVNNVGRSQGWWGEATVAHRPFEDALRGLRGAVSGRLPGSTNIPATSSTATAESTINDLIMEDAEETYGPRDGWASGTWDRVVAAQNDIDSPEYVAAFQRHALAEAAKTGVRSVSPLPVQIRSIARDERIAAGAAAREGSYRAPADSRVAQATNPELPFIGADPFADEVITAEEVKWMQEWKRITGKRYKEGDLQRTTDSARMSTALASSGSDTARTLVVESDEFYDLGTDRGRFAADRWADIAFGEPGGRTIIGGQQYTTQGLRLLSKEERMLLADQWVQEHGLATELADTRDRRATYIETHPTIGRFDAWKDGVRKEYGDDLASYREMVSQGNPNAARYFEGLDDSDRSDEEVDRDTLGTAAFLAVEGERKSLYDDNPISVNDPEAIPYTGLTPEGTDGGSGVGPPKDEAARIAESMATYERKLAEYNAYLADMGITGGLQNLNPMLRSAVVENIRNSGGPSAPSKPGNVEAYERWAAAQPAGQDSSVGAYVSAKTANPLID